METAILLIVAYVVGNLLTATVVGKLFYKQDIRIEGSGNPGARNAGRVLGKTAFTLVFLGDALKCAIVVLTCEMDGNGRMASASMHSCRYGRTYLSDCP